MNDILSKHTNEEIEKFAADVQIPLDLAKKIERKREWYFLCEMDYIKGKKVHLLK